MTALELREPEIFWEDYWKDFHSLWDEFFGEFSEDNDPAVDISETKDHYLLTVEVPGLKENDIKVEHERGVLAISGKWPEGPEGEVRVIRRERPSGEFCRRFNIPEEVDVEKIEAKYKNGLLELVLPKKESAKPKPLKIEIH